MIVAQISDLHIRRRGHVLHYMANTADYLERAISRLNAMKPRPHIVLATGDLVENASPHEYDDCERCSSGLNCRISYSREITTIARLYAALFLSIAICRRLRIMRAMRSTHFRSGFSP